MYLGSEIAKLQWLSLTLFRSSFPNFTFNLDQVQSADVVFHLVIYCALPSIMQCDQSCAVPNTLTFFADCIVHLATRLSSDNRAKHPAISGVWLWCTATHAVNV